MLFRYTKQLIFFVVFPLLGYTGYSFYLYFTHLTPPVVTLAGIDKDSYIAGKIQAALCANNSYKIAELKVLLDGKKYDFKHSPNVKAKNFNLNFVLDTTVLPHGPHCFEIEAIDASHHQNKATIMVPFIIDNEPLKSTFLQSEYPVFQGHTLHTQIQVNKKIKEATITFLSKKYTCYQTSPHSTVYECFIPIDCEEKPNEYDITAELIDHVGNKNNLTTILILKSFDFPKQRRGGFTVESKKLENEKEVSINSRILEEALEKWVVNSSSQRTWSGAFELPITVRKMTTPFGEIRVTPERGRYLHKAVDLVNTPRCVVWASQDGKVIIKDRYLMNGNTIVLDHGLGIFTLYCHLDSFADIEVGDVLKKGSPVGKLGMTGYADAWHLHWELRVNNVKVNPMEWATPNFWE